MLLNIKWTKSIASKILTLLVCLMITIDHDAKFRSVDSVQINLVLTFLISLLCLLVIPNLKKINLIPYYIYILIIFSNSALSLLYTGNQNLQRLLYILQGVFIGIALLKNDLTIPIVRIFVYSFIIFYFYQIFVGVNRIAFFTRGSQNGLTIHLLLLIVLYYISQWQNNCKYDIIPSFLFVLIAAWAKGRSGFFTSVILLLIILTNNIKSVRKKYLRILVIGLICLFVVILLNEFFSTEILNELFISPISSRFSSEGIDSPRSLIWKEYFSVMGSNFSDLLFGVPYREVPIIRQYNNNPHNSILYMHSQYGLMMMLINIILILNFSFRYFKTNIFLLGLFGVLLLRSSTDIIAFPGIFDGIIYYFLFLPFSIARFDGRDFRTVRK